MSYSFSTRAATKALAITQVTDEMNKVHVAQPTHVHDKAGAIAAATAFVNALGQEPSNADKDIVVSMSGSIYQTENGVQQAQVNLSVGYAAKEAAKKPVEAKDDAAAKAAADSKSAAPAAAAGATADPAKTTA